MHKSMPELGVDAPWMQYALRRLGIEERKDGISLSANDEVARMLWLVGARPMSGGSAQGGRVGWVSHHEPAHVTHWCAAFVNACLTDAGIHGTHIAVAKDFLSWGQALVQPRFGAIAVLDRVGGGHVGFYIGTTREGKVELLGGNQNDMVCYKDFNKTKVRSYRWPSLSDKLNLKSVLKSSV